ncbi:FadD7 family fatty acid--CoA ligase [Mycobacterium shigaense]|uniref:Acyl-CoA synthetase n=1 Tax=Mycobacterium shigaense TaxID=722731 RepID=A0A1Z4EBU4_9MYCO|nr:FadD7 family fatty acid--CoA ligase [Mycobacterium shigaense]PRI15404.1 acyl-CoA synthetase [Mycobacterium shigaense]BAX90415.1 acyl-CoA synthetase [Mycobacterium shigaense]
MSDLITPSAELTDESPSVADLVAAAAARDPEAPALVVSADRLPISYRDLSALVEDLAAQLKQGGLAPGDRVGLRTGSSAEFVVGLLAAARAGLVAVPLDPALPVGEQVVRSDAVGARVVLVDGDGDPEAGARWWPLAVTPGGDGRAPGVALDTAAAPRSDVATPQGLRRDDAMIMFTGGTTGVPKMVPWTRANLADSVRAIVAGYRLGPRDATVAVMPLYHGHGLVAALLSTLASGGTVLLPARGKFSAHTFWDDIDAVRATWYTAVPTIHQILLERAKTEQPDSDKIALRFIRSCSAPLTTETAAALQDTFSAPVVCAFGMTEATHQVATTGIDAHENPSETTGLVGKSTCPEIRIAGPDGQPLAAESVGEVWLHGPTVVRGYLGDPAITAANFTDGWLRTGDLGSLSTAGDLTIRGRIKELINRGGEKISPERVEGVLASHPGVLEVAVFALLDKMYGETVAAVIVAREPGSPTPDELAAFCRDRLAPFEIPTSYVEAEELPHTAKGSLDRRAVAEQFGRPA